jgi:hypothetical protein
MHEPKASTFDLRPDGDGDDVGCRRHRIFDGLIFDLDLRKRPSDDASKGYYLQ